MTEHTIGNHSVCPADPLAVEREHHAGVLVLVLGRHHGGLLERSCCFAEISRAWSFQLVVAQEPVVTLGSFL